MRHPTWYAWVVLVVATAGNIGLAVVVSTRAAERTVAAERAAAREAAEENRRATCTLVNAQVSVYRESPPQTPTGREVARAWEDMRIRFHCQGGTS